MNFPVSDPSVDPGLAAGGVLFEYMPNHPYQPRALDEPTPLAQLYAILNGRIAR